VTSSNLEIVERGFEAFNEQGVAIRLYLYPTLEEALSALEQEASS
jgi:hypothetical protein